MPQRRQVFQTALNAEILLENCDGTEIQGAKFNPSQSGGGTVICYGSGVYDWYAPGTGSNQNVKKLTENTLLYLAGGDTLFAAQDFNKLSNLSIYPNPVSNILNIKTEENIETEIYDMNGRRVLTSSSKNIDVQKLKPGTYSTKVSNKNSYISLKFIKK